VKVSYADVIVAPASGAGRSAVAVVRLSGQGSMALVALMCGIEAPEADRRMRLVWLKHPSTGRTLDQAMVVFYGDGASFTGEESVEIFCHGGPVIVDAVVRACIDLGASHAGPGDFTRRAVARGRMDLVQAEAVALLTESENETSADVALEALAGRSSARLSGMSSRLLDSLADCEASLDFDSADDVYVDLSGLGRELSSCVDLMDEWIREARVVRPAVSGFRVVLSGRPNVGKSTLFNALAGGDFAIVHDQPGTTRDVISERVVLAGTGCILFDTAGLRAMAGEVETEGVRRAVKAAADADLVLHVRDLASVASGACSESVLSGTDDSDTVSKCADVTGGRPNALVYTMSDLAPGVSPPSSRVPEVPVFVVCAKTGEGMAALRSYISDLAVQAVRSAGSVAAVVAGERQVGALREARGRLVQAMAALGSDAPLEVVASGIRGAVLSIGEITGSRITDEVLDRIFARFCIGK